MNEKEEVIRLTIPIRSVIHAEMVIAARKDRRSLTNLINLVLEQWVQAIAPVINQKETGEE